jgi:hypothetical protein
VWGGACRTLEEPLGCCGGRRRDGSRGCEAGVCRCVGMCLVGMCGRADMRWGWAWGESLRCWGGSVGTATGVERGVGRGEAGDGMLSRRLGNDEEDFGLK